MYENDLKTVFAYNDKRTQAVELSPYAITEYLKVQHPWTSLEFVGLKWIT